MRSIPYRRSGAEAVVAVLTVHPVSIAATRLRAVQYAPALEAAGYSFALWTFFREGEHAEWYGPSHLGRMRVALRAILRIPEAVRLLRRAAVVVVHREALPFGPPLLEYLAARSAPVVWDVDDAIWVEFESPTAGRVPAWIRGTFGKYRRICRWAIEVWAGSEVLAEWARRYNARVAVVPTVVDVPPLQPASPEPVLAWIGTHSTGPFVEPLLPALAERLGEKATTVIVGASPRGAAGLHAQVLAWSEQTERDVLRRARVGLYPIDRAHPLADGKCGLKAILYMAHGVPPVLTPTRPNRAIVTDGVEGLYAESPEEFAEAVARLLVDDGLWTRVREAGHARALTDYSLQTWAPRIVERVRSITAERA